MHAPLRIGLYAPALPESGVSNGIVTYAGIMRDALRSLGHSVMIVTPEQVERFDGSVVDLPTSRGVVRRIRAFAEGFSPKDGLIPAHRLPVLDAFQAARRAGVQVFEIEESFGWAGRFVGRGVAIVERLHGPHGLLRNWGEAEQDKRGGDLREAAEVASFTKVQAVTAPTQALLDAVTNRYDIELPLARTIPNPIAAVPSAARWRLERANQDQILYVGRFDLLKGADVALRAFALALKQRPQLELVMVGPDNGLVDNGVRLRFDDFAKRELAPEVRKRVSFLGAQPPARIVELRLQSAFSLLTSRFENFPYSLAEAMSVGMPVLSSDTFGAREMVRDGVDGRIVPAEEVGATAQAMVALAGNADQLAAMGRAAQERVAEWLSPERVANETVAVYRAALRRPATSLN